MSASLVGSEMCIRDSSPSPPGALGPVAGRALTSSAGVALASCPLSEGARHRQAGPGRALSEGARHSAGVPHLPGERCAPDEAALPGRA
eukprot:8351797-Alexandrium_andersonii.AAC.1